MAQKPITPAQIRLIHCLKKDRAVTDQDLHALIESETKKTSLKDLTTTEAGKVIARLQPSGTRLTSVSGEPMLTPAQRRYIEHLAAAAGIKDLNAYLKKRHQCDYLNWLTAKKASEVITGLKKQQESLA